MRRIATAIAAAILTLVSSAACSSQETITSATYLKSKGAIERQSFQLMPLSPEPRAHELWFGSRVVYFEAAHHSGRSVELTLRCSSCYIKFRINHNSQTRDIVVDGKKIKVEKAPENSVPTIRYTLSDHELYKQSPGSDIWRKGVSIAQDEAIAYYDKPLEQILPDAIKELTLKVEVGYHRWLQAVSIEVPE